MGPWFLVQRQVQHHTRPAPQLEGQVFSPPFSSPFSPAVAGAAAYQPPYQLSPSSMEPPSWAGSQQTSWLQEKKTEPETECNYPGSVELKNLVGLGQLNCNV